jgi:hypothetical protein
MPPPLWHPPIAIMPYYLCAIVEKFPVLVMPGHRNVAPPPMGAGLAQWGTIIILQEAFSRVKNNIKLTHFENKRLSTVKIVKMTGVALCYKWITRAMFNGSWFLSLSSHWQVITKNVYLSPGSGSMAVDKNTMKNEPVLSGTLT